jgi:hypothetical protein
MASNAQRVTITVPAAVKKQMDEISESVNWSAVAAEAFQRKVNEIRTRRNKTVTKQMVIERLKSAGKEDPKGFEAGREFGRTWAEEKALPRYLRKLAKGVEYAFDRHAFAEGQDPADPFSEPWPLSARLAFTIAGGQFNEWKEFWQKAIGSNGHHRMDGEDFARGFIAGATEVWEDVKDDL